MTSSTATLLLFWDLLVAQSTFCTFSVEFLRLLTSSCYKFLIEAVRLLRADVCCSLICSKWLTLFSTKLLPSLPSFESCLLARCVMEHRESRTCCSRSTELPLAECKLSIWPTDNSIDFFIPTATFGNLSNAFSVTYRSAKYLSGFRCEVSFPPPLRWL